MSIMLLLMVLALGCQNNKTTNDNAISSTDINILSSDKEENVSITNSIMEDNINIKYNYNLPECCKKSTWYTDNIIQEIDYKYHRNDSTIHQYLDDFIISDMTEYMQANELYNGDAYISWFGIMQYDLNNDGLNDYLVQIQVVPEGYYSEEPNSPMNWKAYKAYLYNTDNIFIAISREAFVERVPEYILSTKTNKLNDLMVLSHGNIVIKYDGVNSYSKAEYWDEKYFCEYEQYNDNIVKIKLKMHGVCTKSPSYIAIMYRDNKYFKEDILYCCSPDGTPTICDENYPENVFDDGYIFYAQLKDGVEIPNGENMHPSEIKVIEL